MEIIDKKIKQLPLELQREVLDFTDFLMTRKSKVKNKKKPVLKWMGGLKEYKDHYDSIELQKKSLEWRS